MVLIEFGFDLVFWFYLRRVGKLLTVTDPPVSGTDERARDLHKKHWEVVEELRSLEFTKEPFTQNFIIIINFISGQWIA
jgi:hypothetical protein